MKHSIFYENFISNLYFKRFFSSSKCIPIRRGNFIHLIKLSLTTDAASQNNSINCEEDVYVCVCVYNCACEMSNIYVPSLCNQKYNSKLAKKEGYMFISISKPLQTVWKAIAFVLIIILFSSSKFKQKSYTRKWRRGLSLMHWIWILVWTIWGWSPRHKSTCIWIVQCFSFIWFDFIIFDVPKFHSSESIVVLIFVLYVNTGANHIIIKLTT